MEGNETFDILKLGPDYLSLCLHLGSVLWLVCMWMGPLQAAQVTGLFGSNCCQYITGMLAILWMIRLVLIIKNVIASHQILLSPSLMSN